MVKKDKVQIEVQVDGKQGINELGKLEMEAKDLRATLKDLKKGTEEYNQVNEKLKGTTAEMGRLREQLGLTGLSMRQLTSYQRDLQKEWNGLTKGTAGFEEVDKKLKAVNSTINQQRAELKGTAGVWGFLKSEIGKFGVMAIGALGIQALTGQISNLISKNAKLSDSLADIRKTTGLSAEGVDMLSKKLGELDSRTSKGDLLDIAKSGGQLGIASKDILAFTGAMDKLNVSLGDEFGSAEQITKDMGALRNIFTDIKSDKIDEDMLKIGNAINELGATGAATGDVVADMSSRIGGVGIPLGLAAGQVLGLSATMQELNINTERGSTAAIKILQKMGSDYKEFAKVAGMDTQKFKELLDKDLFGAFTKVIEGVSKTKGGMAAFSQTMDKLKIDGAGASELVGKLGGNMDLLDRRVSLANKSLKNTDSIMNEFNIKNETFGANIDKLGKRLAGLFVNSSWMQGMQKVVNLFTELTEIKLSETLAEERAEMNYLVTAIVSANDEYGTRGRLLDQLFEKFPQMVDGLTKETASNDMLLARLKSVNQEYMKKILMAEKDEKLTEMAKKELKLIKEIDNAQRSSAKVRKDSEDSWDAENEKDVEKLEQRNAGVVDRAKRQLDDLRKQRESFLEGQNRLESALGLKEDPIKSTKKTKDTDTSKENDTEDLAKKKGDTEAEKQKKANDKAMEELRKHLADMDNILEENDIKRELSTMEKRDKELATIDNEFKAKKEKNRAYMDDVRKDENLTFDQKYEALEAFKAKELALDVDWAAARTAKEDEWRIADEAKKAEIQQKVLFETASRQDQELMKIQEHYLALIAEADKFGIDSLAIYRSMDDAMQMAKDASSAKEVKREKKTNALLLAILAQHQNAVVGLTGAVANVLGQIYENSNDDAKRSVVFQQQLGIVQAFISQGVAISQAIAANKLNSDPVTLGLSIATSTITIIGAIASAVGTIRSQSVPSAPSSSGGGSSSNSNFEGSYGPGFYFGGETGGVAGQVRGPVHGEEYVIPSFIRHHPSVINSTAVTEAVRQNAIRSGNTSSSGPLSSFNDSNSSGGYGGGDNGQLMQVIQLVNVLAQKVDTMAGWDVRFLNNEYQRFEENNKKIKFINQ